MENCRTKGGKKAGEGENQGRRNTTATTQQETPKPNSTDKEHQTQDQPGIRPGNLKVLYTNAQSLPSKIDELALVIVDQDPDIVIITETWCNSDINNAFLNLPGYFIDPDLRLDRSDTHRGIGGGIIVYVRNGLTILASDNLRSDFNQYCSFIVKSDSDMIEFICVYRSPNSTESNNDKLVNDLLTHMNKKSNCVLIGDINFPNIDWESISSDKKAASFLKAVNDNFLEQCITFPTHTKGNILDLLIVNNPDLFHTAEDIGRLGKSDHIMICIELRFGKSFIPSSQLVQSWKNANLDGIRERLENTNWDFELSNQDCNGAWVTFHTKIMELLDEYVPKVPRRKEGKQPWMNKQLLREIRLKRRRWKRYKSSGGNPELFTLYKESEKKVQQGKRRAKRALERKLARSEKSDRMFNAYVKSKTKCKVSVGPLKDANGKVISDSMEMAEELNGFFSSVFTREDTSNLPAPRIRSFEHSIKKVNFRQAVIEKKIAKLKPSAAPGGDGIAVKLLQEFAPLLARPLALIFNQSMTEGVVPSMWKEANVTPIYKKGSKSKPGNYRPVSLTSIPCKVMESIIRDHIVDHLDYNNLIANSQHGFLKSRSCVTNLLTFLEVVTEAVDNSKPVDLVYLDFEKAFDVVPKERLIIKLYEHGIQESLLVWIKAWLSGRRQKVVLNGKSSSWASVHSGVPQGSVLGPLAFIIYINDLDEVVGNLLTILCKFADDTKLGKTITCDADRDELQESLDKLCKWSTDWCMRFNTDKCKVMHVGANNPQHEYFMFGDKLNKTNEEKDVGVIIQSNLKPSKQCAEAARKANQVLRQIMRAFHYRDKITFINLYKRYVRVHLEFSVQAWNPWNKADIEVIEDVQMRAVKAVSGLNGKSYKERLHEVGLQSLEDRRVRSDMIQTHKIINGIDRVSRSHWFELINDNRITTVRTRLAADNLNIRVKPCRTELRRNFFTNRVVSTWNGLPECIKTARTSSAFKSAYDQYINDTADEESG